MLLQRPDHPLVLPAHAKEAPFMQPLDGPLERLPSWEERLFSAFYH